MDTSVFNDQEAEQALLSGLLLDQNRIYALRLSADDFTKPEYRDVYRAMQACADNGVDWDVKALMDQGADHGVVVGLLRDAVTAANTDYHAKKIQQMAFARNCQKKILELHRAVGTPEFMGEAERIISEIHESNTVQKEMTVKRILNQVYDKMIEARNGKRRGVLTGFYKINECCVGMYPGHLWVLGGYTSFGKSTILSQMVVDICRRDAGVIVFSVEDSRQDKMTRMVSTVAEGRPIKDIVRGDISDPEFMDAISEITTWPLHIYDDCYTLAEMDMTIRKHQIRGDKVNVVAIDFVQNINVPGAEGIYDRMSQVALSLQRIAKQRGVCILALSQISGDGKAGGQIQLRGAQEIASAADIVLWGEREHMNPEFDLIIRKNRPFGVTGTVRMQFYDKWTKIGEV